MGAPVPTGAVQRRSPLTGEEYVESPRDGRTVCFHGEKVRDVTTHPAFRNSVRSFACMWSARPTMA